MTISSISVETGAKLAKARRGRVKGSKNRKSPEWATKYEAAARFSDVGTIERWRQTIGVERIDEANAIRREVFSTLTMQDREVDAGGRVIAQGAKDLFEHQCLDALLRAGILDDPKTPERARWRLEAGVELLNLWMSGRIMGRSTAAWKAVGGGSRAGVSEADCESIAARAEMKYFRAMESVGDDKEMIRSVCCLMQLPPGTKRSRLNNALDLLSEHLFQTTPPADVVRPKLKVRGRF